MFPKQHVIFCRNVMIYFDPSSRATAVQRLTRHLSPGGYLVVGHSESLLGIHHGLQPIQQGIYGNRTWALSTLGELTGGHNEKRCT